MPSLKTRALNAFNLFKETGKSFAKADTFTLGAALSYYTIFSIAPILFIIITVAGLVYGQDATQGRIYGELEGFLGAQGAADVQNLVGKVYDPSKGILATVIGVGVLIFGATTLFGQLQSSLNKIWEVKPIPKRGFIKMLKDRVLSFSLILVVGFTLLVSLVLSAALSALTEFITARLPDYSIYLFRAIEAVLSLGIITLLIAMIYKYLPDAKVKWRDVWVGSFITSLLFALGKWAIGLYLGKTGAASGYGAAGSIVLILLWVNYSSQILFFGAEFTQAYAQRHGEAIEPADYAIRVSQVEVEQKPGEDHHDFERKKGHIENKAGNENVRKSNRE